MEASDRLRGMKLPPLPAARSWQARDFLNNELQAYEPGSRVTFYVQAQARILGIPLRWRDSTYPAYVVDVRRDDAYFEETARLMISQHEEYVLNHNERAL